GAARALNSRQRTKERIDCRRGAVLLGGCYARVRPCRGGRRSASTLRATSSRCGRIKAAVAHALQSLLAFLWRQVLHACRRAVAAGRVIRVATTATAATAKPATTAAKVPTSAGRADLASAAAATIPSTSSTASCCITEGAPTATA